MIRRVAKFSAWDKTDQIVFRLHDRISRLFLSVMYTGTQDIFCFLGIIKDSLAISPAVGSKEQ